MPLCTRLTPHYNEEKHEIGGSEGGEVINVVVLVSEAI
jgi:hypothetical protein